MTDTTTNLPEIIEDQDNPAFALHFPTFHRLTKQQRRILVAIAVNLTSEENKKDSEIAASLGISRRTIYNARQNPDFSDALAAVCREIVKGSSDKPIQNLWKIAEKDTKANEILLRIAEVYQPTNRNLNLSANISQNSQTRSPESAIEQFILALAPLGYTKERLTTEIEKRYDELKRQGAF